MTPPKDFNEAFRIELNQDICSIQDELGIVVEYLEKQGAKTLSQLTINCITDLTQILFSVNYLADLIDAGNKVLNEINEKK